MRWLADHSARARFNDADRPANKNGAAAYATARSFTRICDSKKPLSNLLGGPGILVWQEFMNGNKFGGPRIIMRNPPSFASGRAEAGGGHARAVLLAPKSAIAETQTRTAEMNMAISYPPVRS